MSCFLLKEDDTPLLLTSDPTGANAVFAVTSGVPCSIEVFAPARYVATDPDSVIVDADAITSVDAEPAPRVDEFGFLRIDALSRAPGVHFVLAIPAPGGVAQLQVFDVSGRVVYATREDLTPQRSRIEWAGRNDAGKPVASGVYFARIELGGAAATQKFVLIK